MSNTRRTTPRPKAAPKPPVITFMGSEYKVADKIGIWPQLQLARAAEAGIMLSDPRGLAAVHAQLENVIHPDDWGRFQDDMITKKIDDLTPLLLAVSDAMKIVAARQGAAQTNGNGGSGAAPASTEVAVS